MQFHVGRYLRLEGKPLDALENRGMFFPKNAEMVLLCSIFNFFGAKFSAIFCDMIFRARPQFWKDA